MRRKAFWLAVGGAAGFALSRYARSTAKPALGYSKDAYHSHNDNALNRELPAWLRGGTVSLLFAGLLWYENRHPLRVKTESKIRRDLRNISVAMLAGATVGLMEKPVTDILTDHVQRKRWGLLKYKKLPVWIEVPGAVFLMDYSMYAWHVLTHKNALLWRFHRVHHIDRDLDATTALRFHFGEMLLSVPWRAMQVVLIGCSRLPLSVWQTMTIFAVLFHHANIRLPMRIEKPLSHLFMTPRMHGIHHSIVDEERNSNWSTIFSFPDHLHRTRRLDVRQESITIGIPEMRAAGRWTFSRLVAMPFHPVGHAVYRKQ